MSQSTPFSETINIRLTEDQLDTLCRLPAQAAKVFFALARCNASMSGMAFPSDVATLAGISNSSARASLSKLEEAGFVRTDKNRRPFLYGLESFSWGDSWQPAQYNDEGDF